MESRGGCYKIGLGLIGITTICSCSILLIQQLSLPPSKRYNSQPIPLTRPVSRQDQYEEEIFKKTLYPPEPTFDQCQGMCPTWTPEVFEVTKRTVVLPWLTETSEAIDELQDQNNSLSGKDTPEPPKPLIEVNNSPSKEPMASAPEPEINATAIPNSQQEVEKDLIEPINTEQIEIKNFALEFGVKGAGLYKMVTECENLEQETKGINNTGDMGWAQINGPTWYQTASQLGYNLLDWKDNIRFALEVIVPRAEKGGREPFDDWVCGKIGNEYLRSHTQIENLNKTTAILLQDTKNILSLSIRKMKEDLLRNITNKPIPTQA